MGVGVDCVQLAGAIYIGTGFLESFEPGHYTMDGGQHAEQSRVIDYLEKSGRFDLVWRREEGKALPIIAGDLLCFKIGRQPHHVGIAVSPVKFVHVHRGHPVKESLVNDTTFRKRLTHVYRPVTDEELPASEVQEVWGSAQGKTRTISEPLVVRYSTGAATCIPCQQRRNRA